MIAHLGIPDMKIPIAYALSYPERLELNLPRLDLTSTPNLEFLAPDHLRFPALQLACQACRQGGTLPAALNGANEVAVEAFLAGALNFPAIAATVAETLRRSRTARGPTTWRTSWPPTPRPGSWPKTLSESGAVS